MNSLLRAMVFFCAVVAVSMTHTAYAADEWEAITPTGTTGYTYNAITTMDDFVYLGTNHGVYLSANRGVSWSQSLVNETIHALAIGTIFDGSAYSVTPLVTPIFAATDSGVFVSTLGSDVWTPVDNGPIGMVVYDVEFDQYLATQGIDTTVYAATQSGVFRSDDAGVTWTSASEGLSFGGIKKLETDFGYYDAEGGYHAPIYAITESNVLYVSELYSLSGVPESWSSVYGDGSVVLHDVSLLSTLGGVTWVSGDTGIVKSNEFALNWTSVNSGNSTGRINVVVSDYMDMRIAYAGSETGGIYRTTNEALISPAWHAINKNLSDASITDIATNPATSLVVYATGVQGVYRLELSDPFADVGASLDTDTTAPVRSLGSPSGTLSANTSGVTLALSTNESATCRYGTVANTAFASIGDVFSTTGGTAHAVLLSGFSNGTSHTYYVRCQDGATNVNTDDYEISFSIAATSGSSSGGGGGGGSSKTVYGCKDKNALNYSSRVTRDNGSCVYVTTTTTTTIASPVVNNAILSTAGYTFTVVMGLGSKGTHVTELQKVLASLGYFTEAPTGYFGTVTEQAVKKFQLAKGLEPVGSVGPQTRALLNQIASSGLTMPVMSNQTILERIAQLLILIQQLSAQLEELRVAEGR